MPIKYVRWRPRWDVCCRRFRLTPYGLLALIHIGPLLVFWTSRRHEREKARVAAILRSLRAE